MLENLAQALALAATFENLLLMFSGMLGGVIIGAIPGLTGTIAVTLVLPFTFYMAPVPALLLLIAIYKGAMYGGSISAILIKTPGTGAAACTVLDGYPLAQQGKAGKALFMALYASCIADFISNLSLIFCAGVIAGFALSFGPPEFFMLICFSLTIVASLSGESFCKGLISAGIGLFLAVIGLDLVYGTTRFTFGSVNLMSGISFIPLIIGLFAIPEVIKACTGKPSEKEPIIAVGGDRVSLAEFMRCLKSILRGSVIGVILGAIPGIGGAPAAFMAYNEARRASPNQDNFGKGEIEGVAAAEAGNNGCAGATLIPLLSLGVPGDVVTAVMLGAFMMHNLTPGPLLFRENIVIVHAVYIGIMISSLLMFLTGIACIRSFSKIANVPKCVLFPCILLICCFGAFSINNSMFDVLVMGLLGIMGYLLMLFKFPEAPLLVAFVLAPLFEDNLRRSLLISHGSPAIFFSSIICWIFFILTLISLGYAAYALLRRKPQPPVE
ncbi:MAG: tripartite tricarboxylate transporter permease [Deltaproteobacteria bacterium]|jgi:putative tricarboxylic transport membrane protein|nr:tripartite tricarboxylate transporter permease [Deltaproteobacteria bacterium]